MDVCGCEEVFECGFSAEGGLEGVTPGAAVDVAVWGVRIGWGGRWRLAGRTLSIANLWGRIVRGGVGAICRVFGGELEGRRMLLRGCVLGIRGMCLLKTLAREGWKKVVVGGVKHGVDSLGV